jgi:hypothetical protein
VVARPAGRPCRLRHLNETARVRHPTETARVRHPTETARVRHPNETARVRHPNETARVRHLTDKARVRHPTETARFHSVAGVRAHAPETAESVESAGADHGGDSTSAGGPSAPRARSRVSCKLCISKRMSFVPQGTFGPRNEFRFVAPRLLSPTPCIESVLPPPFRTRPSARRHRTSPAEEAAAMATEWLRAPTPFWTAPKRRAGRPPPSSETAPSSLETASAAAKAGSRERGTHSAPPARVRSVSDPTAWTRPPTAFPSTPDSVDPAMACWGWGRASVPGLSDPATCPAPSSLAKTRACSTRFET